MANIHFLGIRAGKLVVRVEGLAGGASLRVASLESSRHPAEYLDVVAIDLPPLRPAESLFMIDPPAEGHFVYVRFVSTAGDDMLAAWSRPSGE
jgi:hypothetical protein